MRIVLFCHSLVSCWNHGNAHFLRGIARDLVRRGHEVRILEPEGAWSRTSLIAEEGRGAAEGWRTAYPELASETYADLTGLDALVEGADLVLVHEWNDPALVAALGRLRIAGAIPLLLFHDTHHRAVSDAAAIGAFDLDGYDGVLAFGAVLADRYRRQGWGRQVHVWHEAADVTLFRPLSGTTPTRDLVWIGNWGDDERSAELHEFLIGPAADLGLDADLFGVRYPQDALKALRQAGLGYRGWLPNHRVPKTFARYRATVHVPRRPYATALPGIPTIRMFEALACGIPLVSAPWDDVEGLFPPGAYLKARSGREMTAHLTELLTDETLRRSLIEAGLAAIRARHTCTHRVDELLALVDRLRPASPRSAAA